MKKTFFRLVALLMCLLLIVGIIPTSVFASDIASVSSENTVSFGSKSALDIIASNLSGGTENNDYAISYVEIINGSAYVTVGNVKACKVIVSIYDEFTMQMVCSGIADVPVEHNSIKVDFDADALPEYFVVKVFLVNDEYAPLCEEYTSLLNTTSYIEFLNKDPEDFDEDDVIIFDDSKEQEDFAVLVDDAVITQDPGKMTFSFNEATNEYTFYNAVNDVKKLSVGDIYYYEYGSKSNEFLLIKVKSISKFGSTVKIVQDVDVDLADVFEFVRVDAAGDYDDIELDESQLGEALTVIETNINQNNITTQGDPEFNYDTGDKTWGSTFKVEYPTSDSDKVIDKGVSITGTLGYELATSVKLIYDVKLFGKDYYEFRSVTNHKISLIGFEVEGKIALNNNIVKIPIPPIPVGPFTLDIKIAPLFEISASIGFDVSYNIKMTVTADRDNGMQKTESSKSEWKAEVNDKVEIKFGIEIEFKLKFTEIVSLALNGTGGLKYNGDLTTVGAWIDKHHDCIACVYGDVTAFIEIKLTLKIKIIKDILDFKWDMIKWSKEWDLFDFYISLSTKGFSCGKGECRNISYPVLITVKIKDGNSSNLLKGASVSASTGMCDADGDGKYKETMMATGKDGTATFYFKPGEHTISVSYDKCKNDSQKIRIIKNETKKVEFTLYRQRTAKFIVDGKTYDEIKFYYQDNIRNKVSEPTKDGYEFVGWKPSVPYSMPDNDVEYVAEFKEAEEESDVKWKYNSSNRTLTVYGKGDMPDYSNFGQAPWDSHRDSIKKVVIESGVKSVGDYAFAQCFNLETVEFGDTVSDIGMAAFYQCDMLNSVTLPKSAKTIGDYAFYGCYTINNLSLGGTERIGNYAFAQCTGLTNVTVPSTTTYVGDGAFAWCQRLATITFNNKNCSIYMSSNTIYPDTLICGASNSTAKQYANSFGRDFATVSTAAVANLEAYGATETLTLSYSGCLPGADYILLNVTGFGDNFVLTTSNLEYIDQLTANDKGFVASDFIPRNYYNDSKTLLIGDFGNGVETKIIVPTTKKVEIIINNNPGTLKINFRESVKLQATATEGYSVRWYIDGNYYCDGDLFEYNELKDSVTVTAKLVDANGKIVINDGDEVKADEIISVKNNIFLRIIAFFKFTIFKRSVIKTN